VKATKSSGGENVNLSYNPPRDCNISSLELIFRCTDEFAYLKMILLCKELYLRLN